LRLVDPSETVGHIRHFLPNTKYTSVANAKVIRRADGTGFFVIATPTASSELSKGQYRLNMTYRRNNKATDPNSQMFSQVGNSNPEKVTIDIPWQTRE